MTDPIASGTTPRLSSADRVAPAPPVRIVHVGLGAFHRAHQAWFTAHAADATDWGIAAFTGRRPDAAESLAAQDGLYTLVERGADGDHAEIVGSIVEADAGSDIGRFVELLSGDRVAIVTLTVTEAGYRLREDGSPDLADTDLATDLDGLRSGLAIDQALDRLAPVTALGRLLLALEARRRTGAAPIAVVPCDNLPGNGPLLERGMREAAARVSGDLAAYVQDRVAFVSTSVDRITPRTTEDDVAAFNRRADRLDETPVFTEPFADWVLSGTFPAGRPAWESAGARFVDDIEPWERRKLWLLNGAHTLLAFAGPLRGHETVAAAIADPVLRDSVSAFWDEASSHLPAELDLAAYRAALLTRFDNPRIEHRLAQIAQDGDRKLRLRIVPIAEAELAAGRSAGGCAFAIAAWLDSSGAATSRITELSPTLMQHDDFGTLVASLRH